MANVITGRIWKLDTVSTGLIWIGQVKIKNVYWYNPTNIADTFELKDAVGRTILIGKAEAANGSQQFLLEGWFNGVELKTLTSGVIYLEIE